MACHATHESMHWLWVDKLLPLWSRLYQRNTAGHYRDELPCKLRKYDIEIEERLWSLWGTMHPESPTFNQRLRGRQYLAIYVIACCAASEHHLINWNPTLLDQIVVNGHEYYSRSLAKVTRKNAVFGLRNLNKECKLGTNKFVIHTERVCNGRLYVSSTRDCMNLYDALVFFFNRYQFGIIVVGKRALAIGFCPGPSGGYFMYDCQARDRPLFPKGHGATYLLRMTQLNVLLYCIVITLNVDANNVRFFIHVVDTVHDGESAEEDNVVTDEKDKKDETVAVVNKDVKMQ